MCRPRSSNAHGAFPATWSRTVAETAMPPTGAIAGEAGGQDRGQFALHSTAEGVQDSLCDVGIVEIPDDAMAIIGVVLDRGIVFDRGSDREVVRIQWVERYDIASVKCVVPGVNRRRRSQGSELIADRANRERRTDSHEQWYAKRAAVGAQDAVSHDGTQRMAHDDRGLLGQ